MTPEYSGYLAHHGVKGQKWGVRRYQNEDGTLTKKGRTRWDKAIRDIDEVLNHPKTKNLYSPEERKKLEAYRDSLQSKADKIRAKRETKKAKKDADKSIRDVGWARELDKRPDPTDSKSERRRKTERIMARNGMTALGVALSVASGNPVPAIIAINSLHLAPRARARSNKK